MIKTRIAAVALASLLGLGSAVHAQEVSKAEAVENLQQKIRLSGQLSGLNLQVTERDGRVVVQGFASSLRQINAIRWYVDDTEGAEGADINVVVQ